MLYKNRTVAPWSDARDQSTSKSVQSLERFCQRSSASFDSVTTRAVVEDLVSVDVVSNVG